MNKFPLICFLFLSSLAAYPQNPIIHLPLNGNVNDVSGNNINGTNTNCTLTTDRFGNANSAYEFNGSNSYIILPYNSIYNFAPSGQFSISTWVLPYNSNSISALVVKSEFNSNYLSSLWSYGLYLVNNKGMSGYANNNFLIGSTVLSANACWHHLAVTYNNGIWKLYVDGVLEAQDNSQTRFITQSTSPIGIGRKGAASGDYFQGKLDDIKIYSTALSFSQIKDNMANAGNDLTICSGSSIQLVASGLGTVSWSPTAGLSNPGILNPIANPTTTTQYIMTLTLGSCVFRDTMIVNVENCCNYCNSNPVNLKTGLVGCYDFNGNANDGSGYNNHGTVYGATLTTDRFNKSNRAYSFSDTSSSRIQIPYSASLNNSKVTLSAWVQYGNNSTTQIITKRNWIDAYNEQYAFDTKDFYIKRNSGCSPNIGWNQVNYSSPPSIGVWTFICATYDGRYSKFYKNGVLQATSDWVTTRGMDTCTGGEVIFGATWANFPFHYTGKIDDVRIYNRALPDNEIAQLYTLTSVETPTINAGTDLTNYCLTDSFQLAGSGNGILTWAPIAPLAAYTQANTKGKVSVKTDFVLTNTFGSCVVRDTVVVNPIIVAANAGPDRQICKREVITINGSGNGTNFSWSPIKNISNNLSANPNVNPDTTTKYFLTVTNGSCIARDTVTVFVNPLDVKILTPDTSFCLGDTIPLRATSTGINFIWSPLNQIIGSNTLNPKVFPLTSTWYYLSISDPTCQVKDSVRVDVATISVNAGLDTSICIGDTIQLSGIAAAGIAVNWLPLVDIQNATQLNPKVFPKTSTQYILNGTFGNCKASDTVSIKIDAKPTVSAGPDIRYCFGLSDTLTGTVGNATNFYWQPGVGLSDSTGLNPIVYAKGTTMYKLIAFNGKCAASDSAISIENPEVVASFTTNTLVAIVPADIQFTNTSSNAYFYAWDFGDKSAKQFIKDLTNSYKLAGTYDVWLLASDSLGCLDSAKLTILITEDPFLKVANVFTPNGDSINDYFGVVYNAQAFEFLNYQIYSRWGELLYQTKMPGGNWWNGNYKGNPCPDGVYFYLLDAKTLSGKEYNLHGTVTLLR